MCVTLEKLSVCMLWSQLKVLISSFCRNFPSSLCWLIGRASSFPLFPVCQNETSYALQDNWKLVKKIKSKYSSFTYLPSYTRCRDSWQNPGKQPQIFCNSHCHIYTCLHLYIMLNTSKRSFYKQNCLYILLTTLLLNLNSCLLMQCWRQCLQFVMSGLLSFLWYLWNLILIKLADSSNVSQWNDMYHIPSDNIQNNINVIL